MSDEADAGCVIFVVAAVIIGSIIIASLGNSVENVGEPNTAYLRQVAAERDASLNKMEHKLYWKITAGDKSWYAVGGNFKSHTFTLVSGETLNVRGTYTHGTVLWMEIPDEVRKKSNSSYRPSDVPEDPAEIEKNSEFDL